jgi:hypothetical protein
MPMSCDAGTADARHPFMPPQRLPPGADDLRTRVAGLLLTTIYAVVIGWLYARQPQTIAQVTGGITNAIGIYKIDDVSFEDGRRFFRNDQFVEARLAFARADPAVRDARTQFYIAYSYYREGWGRFYQDDRLYSEGLTAVDRAIALAPGGRLVVDDQDLKMQTGEELKAALQSGLEREPSDLNPLRVFRERK